MGKNGFDFVKIDKTVIKETKYISTFVIILSVLMQAVFLIIDKWNYTVLLGNLWGACIAVGNFFVMGLFIQKAVTQEADEAKKTVKGSMSLRFMAMLVLVVIGVAIPKVFHFVAVLLPLLFPQIAIFIRSIVDKNKDK